MNSFFVYNILKVYNMKITEAKSIMSIEILRLKFQKTKYTCFFIYKKHDFKKHEAEITGPVDC